jgi:hypothetical protein
MCFDYATAPLGTNPNELDLANQRIHVGRNRIILACVGVEIAIGAAMFAKRDVEVE